MNAIEIKDLRKDFSAFSLSIPQLTLPTGCIMGLIGENGAGKSTTIKLLLDIAHPSGGTISVLGRNAGDPIAKQDIGVVLDEVGIPQNLNTRQVGRIMAGIFTRWDQDIYEDFLRRFHIPYGQKFKTFSRGTKMKLGLAIALSHHPKLLLLDEATSGLDPVVRDELLDVFLDFTRDEGHSILISSHIVSDLEKLCDYIAFLHEGRLTLCEEKDRLLEEYGLLRCGEDTLDALPEGSVLGRRCSPYGTEALVRRSALPAGVETSPIDIEQLFIFMAREAL